MKFLRLPVVLLLCGLALHSCVKQSYDNPPSTAQYDPGLPVQTTLRQLSDMIQNMPTNTFRKMGDTTIQGVVIANDHSGNVYKQIIIEDTSKGGIVLYIDRTGLYADYPEGRKVYVKLKGLYIMNYKGLPEVVYSVDSAALTTTGIPGGLITDYVVKANYPSRVDTQNVSIIDVKSNPNKYMSTLLKIDNVQFNSSSQGPGVTYALSSTVGSGTSRTVEDCSHTASVVMYNSNYASFQPYLTPTGNGSLLCVCSNYYGTLQMLIRDTTDVKFYNPRCN